MKDFVIENKEVLAFIIPLIGMLLSLCFGGILNWRHKICIDYEGRRDVAINILQDRYVQQTTAHHADVLSVSHEEGIEVEEVYKRKKQREVIRELAKTLEDINRIKRYFRWLEQGSLVAFRSILLAIPLSALPLISIRFNVAGGVIWIWIVVLTGAVLLFFGSMFSLTILDGRFFKLVNRVIEPVEAE